MGGADCFARVSEWVGSRLAIFECLPAKVYFLCNFIPLLLCLLVWIYSLLVGARFDKIGNAPTVEIEPIGSNSQRIVFEPSSDGRRDNRNDGIDDFACGRGAPKKTYRAVIYSVGGVATGRAVAVFLHMADHAGDKWQRIEHLALKSSR